MTLMVLCSFQNIKNVLEILEKLMQILALSLSVAIHWICGCGTESVLAYRTGTLFPFKGISNSV